ncbi:DDE-type integrase/transposase/recombinase [Roseomonas chloroacetimidivorans]|uniref:DDE-type integrase/transposase/recombinase n=1 Tax=Roseomonas chloroacetimidivorans TaxID=1766656 RepID=UPI003C724087
MRDWEAKLTPVLTAELRQRRRSEHRAGCRSRHADETYLKDRGRWCFLYCVINRNGDPADTLLSEHHDMAAAQAFLRLARSAAGMLHGRATMDGHGSYPCATCSTLGRHVKRRTSAYRPVHLKSRRCTWRES